MKTSSTATKSIKSKSNATKEDQAKGNSKKINNGKNSSENDSQLEEFFHGELKDIYWAEKHLIKVLPKMSKAATSPELKNAFIEHLEVTKGHAERLEEIFSLLGYKPQAKKCDAMEGITKEGESIIEETKAGTSTRDVGLIFAGQKVEHYEIATYGSLAQLAETLGYNDVAKILSNTLAEEKEADESLTELAENTINEKATAE